MHFYDLLAATSQALHDVMDKEPAAFLTRGILGVGATTFSVITSFQEQLEWGVRFTASTVGLAIAVLTLASMIRKLKSNKDGQ
jgi:hypothetical protein